MKVCTVVGARPQFIKAAVVSRQLRERHEEVLVHTGQHYDDSLSGVFFDQLAIPIPDYNLEVGSAGHGPQTAEMVAGIADVCESVEPDVLLTYGDTNSTLAGAIVGAKRDLLVAHVEAGVRSHNRSMPEEINRVLTDHAADLCLAPTAAAMAQLEAESVAGETYLTGDVMYDAILEVEAGARDHSTILESVGVEPEAYILATVHRAGNTDDRDRLEAIVEGLSTAPLPVVFPAHPRTVTRLEEYGLLEQASRKLILIEPVGYRDFVRLLGAAERVATDSGGVQKEAFFLDTPCLTFRTETEWPETVDCGWNELVRADSDDIRAALSRERSLDSERKPRPFGDGLAAKRVVRALETTVADARSKTVQSPTVESSTQESPHG